MSKDISSQYTKDRNNTCGRRGYFGWKHEKDTVIIPDKYGEFLNRKRRRNR